MLLSTHMTILVYKIHYLSLFIPLFSVMEEQQSTVRGLGSSRVPPGYLCNSWANPVLNMKWARPLKLLYRPDLRWSTDSPATAELNQASGRCFYTFLLEHDMKIHMRKRRKDFSINRLLTESSNTRRVSQPCFGANPALVTELTF